MPRSSMHVYIAVQSPSLWAALLFVITRPGRKSSWLAALSHCKQFFICVFPKRFCQASLPISTTYFKNKILMFCRELWCSEEKYEYKMQPFSCYNSKRNYEITVVQEIHISRLELQRWSLEFVLFFSKVYIWDLGLRFGANSFWDHVMQISR